MITRVQKWGNSQGMRLSKEILAETGIEVGDQVDVSVQDGSLVVTPSKRVRGGVDLAELVRRIPEDFEAGEYDWGAPEGREVW